VHRHCGMTSRMDIWRAAKFLVGQHGAGATIRAVRHADKLLAVGDMKWRLAWLGILRAVEELIRREPKQGERIN